jgi:hypothetical protein
MSNSTVDRIKKRYEEITKATEKQPSTGNNLKWKPSPGKQTIRILPYKWNEDPNYPFIELAFYYSDVFGKTWLSPASVGNPDPVLEFAATLTGGKRLPIEEWKTANNLKKKITPKQTFMAPILVRDQEGEGVKFWTFSLKVYKELLEIMSDSSYGLISDLDHGIDITVTFTPNSEDPKLNSTTVLPRREATPATNDPEVKKSITNMPDIVSTFTVPTEEQLSNALAEYLSGAKGKETPAEPAKSTNASASAPKSQPATKNIIDDITSEFDDILNSDLPF